MSLTPLAVALAIGLGAIGPGIGIGILGASLNTRDDARCALQSSSISG